MNPSSVYLALGVFLGNWFLVPLLFKRRTFTEGFFVGLVAAILVLVFCVVTER